MNYIKFVSSDGVLAVHPYKEDNVFLINPIGSPTTTDKQFF